MDINYIQNIQNLLAISDAMLVDKEYVDRQLIGYTTLEHRKMKLDKVLNKIESKKK